MPDYSDNTDDVEGYLDIARKIVGDDMIQAKTVNDFIAQKWPAPAPQIWSGVCFSCQEGDHKHCADSAVLDCTCYDNGHAQ
jgi:hypothetical protein